MPCSLDYLTLLRTNWIQLYPCRSGLYLLHASKIWCTTSVMLMWFPVMPARLATTGIGEHWSSLSLCFKSGDCSIFRRWSDPANCINAAGVREHSQIASLDQRWGLYVGCTSGVWVWVGTGSGSALTAACWTRDKVSLASACIEWRMLLEMCLNMDRYFVLHTKYPLLFRVVFPCTIGYILVKK